MRLKRIPKGLFIVFSGPDGSGKSSQVKLLTEWLVRKGYDVVATKEPGGDQVCADIRKILVHGANEKRYDPPIADGMVEFFLFCADRRQHVQSVILPALREGKIVVCDRYVQDTFAYQCRARRALDQWEFKYIMDRATVGLHVPDLTFWLDLDVSVGIRRKLLKRGLDRFEAEDLSFHQAVANGFAEFFHLWPEFMVTRIDASQTKGRMERQIRTRVSAHLRTLGHVNPAP